MSITHKEIVEILSHLEGSACEEFTLHIDGVELMLRRKVDVSVAPLQKTTISSENLHRKVTEKKTLPNQDNKKPKTASLPQQTYADGASHFELRAPMSGVFYRRPSPEEPNFVEVGGEVKDGDPLCVIEVMKLFSTVHASCSGRISSIQVEDGQSIEKGQLLITIDISN